MKNSVLYLLVMFLFAVLTFPEQAISQKDKNKPQISDRIEFLKEETNLFPDVRRIPIPDNAFASEDSLAIIGGRLFDGTGKTIRYY